MIRTNDLNWVVGFLEGEGAFFVDKKCTPYVTACQVQKWPLEKMHEMFGGSLYWRKNKTQGIYQWVRSGRNAAGMMMAFYTLLSPRRKEQIRKSLASWKSRGKLMTYRTHCPVGHSYDYIYTKPSGGKQRVCKTCARAAKKRSNERKKLCASS